MNFINIYFRIFFLVFLGIFSNYTSISQPYQGVVLDAESKSPIPFVNIGIVADSRGTVSDNDGNFLLEQKNLEEIITFSSIGYEVVELSGKDLLRQSQIFLKPKAYNIPQIEVIGKKFGKAEIFGVRNKSRGLAIGFGGTQLGTEMGALIPINKPTLLKDANFVIVHAKGDSMHFRVNIYDYKNSVVGPKLINENIFIVDKQRKGTITVDLSNFNLIVENDVMLSLEWIRDFDSGGNKDITFDTKKGKKLKGVYYKYASNTGFKKMPFKAGLNPCFYLVGKSVD